MASGARSKASSDFVSNRKMCCDLSFLLFIFISNITHLKLKGFVVLVNMADSTS